MAVCYAVLLFLPFTIYVVIWKIDFPNKDT